MNVTAIWEGLTHCEQLSYMHQMGKFMVNTFDLNSTQTENMTVLLWRLFMQMIDEGCWV